MSLPQDRTYNEKLNNPTLTLAISNFSVAGDCHTVGHLMFINQQENVTDEVVGRVMEGWTHQ